MPGESIMKLTPFLLICVSAAIAATGPFPDFFALGPRYTPSELTDRTLKLPSRTVNITDVEGQATFVATSDATVVKDWLDGNTGSLSNKILIGLVAGLGIPLLLLIVV